MSVHPVPDACTVRLKLEVERDIIVARQQARALAVRVGFGVVAQTQIAAAVSELARNVVLYAVRGSVEMRVVSCDEQHRIGIEITVADEGPGIADVDLAMSDGFSSSAGLGLGLPGTRRLMDSFRLETNPGIGTRIEVRKWLRSW